MRKYLVPAALALLAIAPAGAFAASTKAPAVKPAATAPAEQSVMGVVKAIDLKAHTLTLADGKSYTLPATFKDNGLKAGEKVTVHFKVNGSARDITSVAKG